MQEIENWKEEKQSAWLYRVMTSVEKNTANHRLFDSLAAAAEEQALIWEDKVAAAGGRVPMFTPSLRSRLVAVMMRAFGPQRMLPVLAAMKVRGLSVYSHGGQLVVGHPMPRRVEDVGHRHAVAGGGNLRAAVFGINDGLVSNAALVMGVAGAVTDNGIILLTGVAGLIAGAASMAAGEYVSVRSQRELYEYQIRLEREELEEYPEEEAEELALIYNARGLDMEQARNLASEIMQDGEQALDTLSREELGLNPEELGSPWGAALSSFASFGIGALIPLLPFLYAPGSRPVQVAIILTGIALFFVGALVSLFSGRSAWYGGARMVVIGGGAGLLAYGIGAWLGVSML